MATPATTAQTGPPRPGEVWEQGTARTDAAAGGGIDRFTWGIVAGVALLVIIALAGVTLLQRQAAPPDLARPDGVVRAYVEAIDSGHPERAWDLLATPARTDVTREEFLRRATSLSQRPPGRVAIERVDVEGDIARVEMSRTFAAGPWLGPSPPIERTTVRLIREEGEWRIEVPPEPWLISRDSRIAP